MKKVFKYATGQEIPKGAIYLCSLKNGRQHAINTTTAVDHGEYEDKREYVWHYFLVEISPKREEKE